MLTLLWWANALGNPGMHPDHWQELQVVSLVGGGGEGGRTSHLKHGPLLQLSVVPGHRHLLAKAKLQERSR